MSRGRRRPSPVPTWGPALGVYPGAKSGAGVAHRIIQQMPPHQHYFELFLGHGSIIRAKARAPGRNVGCDVDGRVIDRWRSAPWPLVEQLNDLEILKIDALRILSSDPTLRDPGCLVYCDPPYLREVRTRRLYTHEFWNPAQHEALLCELVCLPSLVMVSGYPSPLYSTMLEARAGWRFIDYPAPTRGGPRMERLWMNYPQPATLHDPRFGGVGFRDRDRVKRKKARWAAKFEKMPVWERQLVREALEAIDKPACSIVKPAVVRSPKLIDVLFSDEPPA